MNLQGIWNPLMLAPWRSNFHINVNIQEAYWFAEQANLSECHEPIFTLTENLIKNGKETAQYDPLLKGDYPKKSSDRKNRHCEAPSVGIVTARH